MPKPPSGGRRHSSYTAAAEDRLSALPDDVLVLILLGLDTAAGAGRTGVLSRRWRPVWKLLPELRFPAGTGPLRIRAALSAIQVDLRCLHVRTRGATPESVRPGSAPPRPASPAASASGTGRRGGMPMWTRGKRAPLSCPVSTAPLSSPWIWGFSASPCRPPPSSPVSPTSRCGASVSTARATSDVVSSPRCPRLETLHVDDARGLRNLAIHSESLVQVSLDLCGLWKLTLVAPKLRRLGFIGRFDRRGLVANISAPQLESLRWMTLDDLSCVQFGEMAHIKELMTQPFGVYQSRYSKLNHSVVSLLAWFRRFTGKLSMPLLYPMSLLYPQPHDIGNFQYLMEDLTLLPGLVALKLLMFNRGHSFGASVSHLLRMCVGLKDLSLHMQNYSSGMEAQSACPQGCFCGKPSKWMTEELTLNCLQHVEVHGMKGDDNEVTFLKRLFHWATVLETMSITFSCSVSESKARELHQTLSSFSRPETRMEFLHAAQ